MKSNYLQVNLSDIKYNGWYIKFLASKLEEWEQIDSKMTIEEFTKYIENKSK